jgi:hypothetical protein
MKDAVDSDDFLIKLEVAVKTSDKEIMENRLLEWESNIIEVASGRGWANFLKNDEIFDVEKKYISYNTLTLIIYVRTSIKTNFKFTFLIICLF